MTSTANHLITPRIDPALTAQYQNALGELSKEFQRVNLHRSVWSIVRAAPRDLLLSKFLPFGSNSSTGRRSDASMALTRSLPENLLKNMPESRCTFSLMQGFEASIAEQVYQMRKQKARLNGKNQKLLGADNGHGSENDTPLGSLKREKQELHHRLEMMGIRKSICGSELREIDTKISKLHAKRNNSLDRLAALEQDELELERELQELSNNIEDMEELELETETEADGSTLARPLTPSSTADVTAGDRSPEFMSASIYEKLPSPQKRHPRAMRRKSMPILHEHLESGSKIKEFQAHDDTITALDFDAPFGTGVTAALDDTVRIWDLNAGRCVGLLEGHLSSVRCLQVEDNLVATGSMDATIKIWDLDQIAYPTPLASHADTDDDGSQIKDDESMTEDSSAVPKHPNGTHDCLQHTLESHVAEVTALHFKGNTLVSGSADKTIRQWDLVKGRCIQTLDVLWAAAQVSNNSNISNGTSSTWRSSSRAPDASADFVGALQCFDAALACGTADGMVRLWDLRSGQVHRSLVGHTGPVSCLQFDDVYLVTGSLDRSIRVRCCLQACSIVMLHNANNMLDMGSANGFDLRCFCV